MSGSRNSLLLSLAFASLALVAVVRYRHHSSANNTDSKLQPDIQNNLTSEGLVKGTTGVAQVKAETSLDRQPAQTADPLTNFLNSKDPDGNWVIQKSPDGRPSHILGGRIAAGPGVQNISRVLKEVAPHLGVKSDDLRVVKEEDTEGLSNSSQMSQYYGKHRVYGSTLKAFSNPNTDEIYHIVSELRPIETVDTQQRVDRSQAAEIVRKLLATTQINSIKTSKEPLVYGTTATDNQLVWRILVTSEKPTYQSLQFLVATRDGAVVDRRSLLSH